MDKKVLLQGLGIIEACTGKTFGDEQIKVYTMLLDNLEEEAYIQGVQRLMCERVYTNLPSVAEIREYCLGTRESDLDFRIAEATKDIKKALSSVGMYKEVAFSDYIIHCIIQNEGGWTKFCSQSMDDIEKWFKWDFPKLYRAYVGRQVNVPLFLTGIGYSEQEKPRLNYVGGKEKIERWQLAYLKKNGENMDSIEYHKAEQLNMVQSIGCSRMNKLIENIKEKKNE